MSHIRVKTEYNENGSYGSIDKHTLYAWHNNSCDVISIYDEDGQWIMSFDDCLKNNLLDAINRICAPYKSGTFELDENVEYMNEDDKIKCNL